MKGYTSKGIAQGILSLLLCATLICSTTPQVVRAEEGLEALENAAIEASEKYAQAQQELDDLNKKVEDNQSKLKDLEAKLPEAREDSAEAMRLNYKLLQSQPNLIGLILSSRDFSDFLSTLSYINAINDSNFEKIQHLIQMESQLTQMRDTLRSQQSNVAAKTKEAATAQANAQAAIEAARKRAMQRAAEAKAKWEAEQAAAAAERANASGGVTHATSDANNTSTSTTPNSNNASSTNYPSNVGSGGGEWKYVGASVYGNGDGFMWGTTASGDTVTPTSMGVAMKRPMPLGTTIEINYNGRTVRAVVNDRGPFIAGREIDLQPAVADALGFDGVGTVSYRVV